MLRFLLLLEDKSTSREPRVYAKTSLRKRLSPLRYSGGKSKLIDYLYSLLFKEQLDTFTEVFAGGASLGLSLLDAGIIQHLILNDKDPAVYAFWKTVLEEPQTLVRHLQDFPPTHKELADAKARLAEDDTPSAELGLAFLLANRLSYSGIIKANAQGGKEGTQKDLLARWNPNALQKRIMHIHSLRDNIALHNKDAVSLIEESVYWNSHSTLFVDPPYFSQGKRLYTHFFRKEDHENLAFLLSSLYMDFPESDIIVTYDNHPYIRELYPFAQTEYLSRKYSI